MTLEFNTIFGQRDVRETSVTTPPKAQSAVVGGPVFRGSAATNYTILVTYLRNDSAGSGYTAAIQLPQGAIITSAVMYGSNTAKTWSLYRGATTSATSSVIATAAIGTISTTITNGTVDNSSWQYTFYTASADNADQFYSAKVNYIL